MEWKSATAGQEHTEKEQKEITKVVIQAKQNSTEHCVIVQSAVDIRTCQAKRDEVFYSGSSDGNNFQNNLLLCHI